MATQPRAPISPTQSSRIRPQTAATHRPARPTAQPLIFIPGRPQSAHTLPKSTPRSESPRSIWLRLFRPSSKDHTSSPFVQSRLGTSAFFSLPSSRSGSPNRGINAAALAKALKTKIHPQVQVNGYSLGRVLKRIRPYIPSPPKSPSSSHWSEQELTSIAHSKSLENFLRLLTGKSETRLKPHKPPVPTFAHPKPAFEKRNYCSLLDGKKHAESHTKGEQEARSVMDNLYKRFTRVEQNQESADTCRSVQLDKDKNSLKEGKSEPGIVRIRPISASVTSKKSPKRVSFRSPVSKAKQVTGPKVPVLSVNPGSLLGRVLHSLPASPG